MWYVSDDLNYLIMSTQWSWIGLGAVIKSCELQTTARLTCWLFSCRKRFLMVLSWSWHCISVVSYCSWLQTSQAFSSEDGWGSSDGQKWAGHWGDGGLEVRTLLPGGIRVYKCSPPVLSLASDHNVKMPWLGPFISSVCTSSLVWFQEALALASPVLPALL